MKIAYISGPYRSNTKEGIEANIQRAKKYAEMYWEKGYAALCPHMNSAHMDGVVPDTVFLEGDLEFIRRLIPGKDVLVVIPGWEKSSGTKGEIGQAIWLGIDVIYEK